MVFLSQECYSNVELMTSRNFSISFARVLTQELISCDCAMDRERVVASIVALLFLIVAIRKAQRFRFLALYLVFERRQRDLANALLTTRIKRLQEQRRRRGALARRRRVAWVYPRPQGWFEEMYRNPVMFSLWKNDFIEFLRRHLTTFVNWSGHTSQGKTRVSEKLFP